jgi:endonuclease/exonuclease/phosphatase family metal-dependent hydrolase
MLLRVMSFNVRVRTVFDVFNPWHRRRDQLADQVRQFDPDLLGTQELSPTQADDLRERLPDYNLFGAGRNDGDRRGEMCGVFFKTNRFDQTGGGHFWLSRTPAAPGSKLPWTIFPRIVSWAKLRPRGNGRGEPATRELAFFNTHFPVVPASARVKAARVLREQIVQLVADLPCIVTGDFNDVPGSETHAQLTTAAASLPFHDTHQGIHPSADGDDAQATLHHFRGGTRGRRIDWILASASFRCRDASIDRARGPRGYASDHYPVTAVLELPA